jgi:hypothetical protein
VYKNGEAALDRILELVTKCPKELQEKCFEVLLSGYVQLEVGAINPRAHTEQQRGPQPQQQTMRRSHMFRRLFFPGSRTQPNGLGSHPKILSLCSTPV